MKAEGIGVLGGVGTKQNQELYMDMPISRCPLYHQIKMSFGGRYVPLKSKGTDQG